MIIIESDEIKGAALFNGFSTYGGWADDTTTAAQITVRVNLINSQYSEGKIDNPSNLATAPIYVFRGDQDFFPQKPQADLFTELASSSSSVEYVVDSTKGHDFGET